MINRASFPNAAFAYTGKIGGLDFRLLRHHNEKVKNGNDNDSIDLNLLVASLKMIDEIPVSAEEREKIRKHLMTHASIFKLDLTDPEMAKLLINQTDGGSFELANKELNRSEYVMPSEPELHPGADITKAETAKAAITLDTGEKDVGPPDRDLSDKPLGETKTTALPTEKSDTPLAGDGNSGDGHKVELDEGAVDQSNPNTDKLGKASIQESDEKKNSIATGAWTTKSINDLPDSSFAVIEQGGTKDESGKTAPRGYRHLPYKDASGKVDLPHLRNALARMNQIQAVSPKDSTERIRAAARKVLAAAAKKALPNTKFAKESVNDEVFSAENALAEIDILVEAARKKKKAKKTSKKVPTVYPKHKAWMSEMAVEKANELIQNVISGKVTAKILSAEKVGSVEYVDVKLGDDKDYPHTIMMNISRDGAGNVMGCKIMNEVLPGTILGDLAKYLAKLAGEVGTSTPPPVAASTITDVADLATAPAKLEKCKTDVFSKMITTFTKKNGHPPSEKQRKSMESSAYAICTTSLKKSGQM